MTAGALDDVTPAWAAAYAQMPERWLPLGTTAAILGISRAAVHKLADSGRLDSGYPGGTARRVLGETSVRALRAEQEAALVPPDERRAILARSLAGDIAAWETAGSGMPGPAHRSLAAHLLESGWAR